MNTRYPNDKLAIALAGRALFASGKNHVRTRPGSAVARVDAQ
jgi:hypothetical protein